MSKAIQSFRIWADMVKLAHSVFALPFALIAAFLAGQNIENRGYPYWGQLGLVVLCMVAGRSVAMTFNRIVDAQIDARNPRTAMRPIPAGALSIPTAWMMLALAGITFAMGCFSFYMFYDNPWPMFLGGPTLLYLCGYSLTKRFTKWSHYYLGSAIALSPVAAWLAIHPASLGWASLILMLAVTFWIAGFDVIYACQDIECDTQEGLHSLPSRLGPQKALWVARASHGITIAALVALGVIADFGLIYAVGVGIVLVLLVVENAIVKPGDYSKVNLAFFTINGIVSIVLALAAIADLMSTSGGHS